MKKIPMTAVVALGLVAASAIAQDPKKAETKPAIPAAAPPVDLKEAKVKVSYSLGQQMAILVKRNGYEIDFDSMIKGLREGLDGAKPAYSQAEVEAASQVYRQDLMVRQAAAAKKAAEKNKTEGAAYLAANKAKPGVQTTKSGLQYKVITEGTGRLPKLTDYVSANYRGTFLDGTEFDSSAKYGGPQSFQVSQVIRGWTEALQLMKEGSKWQLVIPSDLAYGPEGKNPGIPPNAVLLFDIEFVKIESESGIPPTP